MKKTISNSPAAASNHPASANFSFVTYLDPDSPYNPDNPIDNSFYTGYYYKGFNYFVFFPNGNCQDAYTVAELAFVDANTRKKMFVKVDPAKGKFIIWHAKDKDHKPMDPDGSVSFSCLTDNKGHFITKTIQDFGY